uniref:Uncharacterized protein n=1 Tax=Candidatus Methanogaster sp. ANME-2c ERB4 TaxID=2759911 RepID=A0A7G9YIX9_9EURY|nr:hypothetical protein KNONPEEI_00001 [Methanosarcinales archaeon ANME-2c ERB4]QNO48145.1 hypothetical protein GOJLPIDM_00001 [Methanosarcinales archaeon ANME-2c ERB4]
MSFRRVSNLHTARHATGFYLTGMSKASALTAALWRGAMSVIRVAASTLSQGRFLSRYARYAGAERNTGCRSTSFSNYQNSKVFFRIISTNLAEHRMQGIMPWDGSRENCMTGASREISNGGSGFPIMRIWWCMSGWTRRSVMSRLQRSGRTSTGSTGRNTG